MARVKLCGINSAHAMDAAVAAGADWVGFVFANSPRRVTPDQAEALSARHPGGPLRVGLFVDPTDQEIEAALEAVPFDVLQLYTPPDRGAELRAAFGVPVWRAIGVSTASDLPTLAEPIDGYVLEAKPPRDATRLGGIGQKFDWTMLRGWGSPLPWLLAGGLTPDNVAAAIATSGATAVDVSSGIESAPGVKDEDLIRRFVQAAQRPRDHLAEPQNPI